MRLKIFEKLKKKWNSRKETVTVPSSWVKPSMGKPVKTGVVEIETKSTHRKWRIPLLRPVKRVLAAVCMVFNFVVSQITWTSDPRTQGFAIVFLINTFLMADYLWKTRKQKEAFED